MIILNIGDIIYKVGNYGIDEKLTVDSVTEKRAKCGFAEFKREVVDGCVKRVNEENWAKGIKQYYTESQSLKDDYEKQEAAKFLNEYKGFSKLSLEQLRSIKNIITV